MSIIENITMKKRCIKCNKKQDTSCFQKDIDTKDGLSKKCKKCEGTWSSNHNQLLNEHYPDHQVLASWPVSKQMSYIEIWDRDPRKGIEKK